MQTSFVSRVVKGFLFLAGVFSGGVAESGRVAVFCFFGGVGCEGLNCCPGGVHIKIIVLVFH